MNKLIIVLAVGALIASLCSQNWIQAQKTIKKNFQQISSSSNSLNPGSVYGGYSSSSSNQRVQQQTALVAPVQQQRYSSSSIQSSSSNSYVPPRPISSSSNSYQQQTNYEENTEQASADSEPASYGSVNGEPGKDFPAYTRIPKTSFSCDGLPYDYGMYADEETGCQAYHVCYNGRKDSFLCGVGTVFNQRILHCDYWYSVDCGKSSQYYSSNAYMGSSQPEPGPAQASGSYNKISKTQISQQSSVNAGLQPVKINRHQSSSSQWIRETAQQQEEAN